MIDDIPTDRLEKLSPTFPKVFRNVTIGPLMEGSNKSKLVFEVDPPQLSIEQTKSLHGRLFDSAELRVMSAEAAGRARVVEEPTIFAGPYLRHFGHFVAESIHRLYAKSYFPELRSARVVFLGSHRKYNPILPWVSSVFAVCGVDIKDVIFLDEPIKFRELYVPLQGRVFGGVSLLKGYEAFFPPRPASSDRTRKLYFTRSNHLYSGGILGERLIGDLLSEAGFEIVFAERLPTAEVVELIRRASICLFSEGSAVHNLELSGRVDGKVGIISRRPHTTQRFNYLLDDLALEWKIFEEWPESNSTFVHMDWNVVRNAVSAQKGCVFLDIRRLLQDLSSFTETEIRTPTAQEVRDAVSRDIGEFVMDARSTASYTPDDKLGLMLRDAREKWEAYSSHLTEHKD